jgi:hypothetical protein
MIEGLNSSVGEHWTENPRAVGSIPTLSNLILNSLIFIKLHTACLAKG